MQGDIMSKTNNDKETQKPKICKMAIMSLLFAALGFLIFYFYKDILVSPATARQLCIKIMCLIGVIGFIFGMGALLRIKKSKQILRGVTLSILGMVLCLCLIGIWYLITRPHCTALRMLCGSNVNLLGKATLFYQIKNDHYPEPNQWCDLLLNDGEVEARNFICPNSLRATYLVYLWPFKSKITLRSPFTRKGRCSYAINPNCHPNSPPDTVFLFETKDGWNQYGGKEILTKENHYGDGCNVLHNDMHCTYESFPEKLNWGDKKDR